MHASFLSKRWENKHVLSGIQETVSTRINANIITKLKNSTTNTQQQKVIDQTVQLNRVLRLLNEEQYALCQRCHIGGGRGSGGRLRHHRRTISYDPFQVSLDSSNMLLRRQKQFEVISSRFLTSSRRQPRSFCFLHHRLCHSIHSMQSLFTTT